MRGRKVVPRLLLLLFLVVGVGQASAGPRFLKVDMDSGSDGNGPYVNLIVREVRVTPIVAHVGDIIRIEMVMENRGENVNKTVPAEIWANKKVVASRLFTFGWGDPPGGIFRETFEWNTRGASPGEYRIKGEASVWEDASPFDNFLRVEEPLVLLPAGAVLPAGKEDGGTAVAVDPRWSPKPAAEASPARSTGGY
jgi:hypothetical protein